MHIQPVEDINVVMGRFQAWAGSRTGSDAPPKVRELSCEEALESSRYHWKGGKGARGSAAVEAAQNPVAQRSQPVPAKPRKAGHRSPTKVRARGFKPRSQAHTAASEPTKPKPGAKSAVARAAEGAEPPMSPAPFKDALAQAIHPAEVVVSPTPHAELARQVAISIRLAASERALIRARAAEAGVTVSAYVRQCALEVEQLRAQVRQRLETMARETPASDPTKAPSIFARLLRRLFPSTARTLAVRV